MRLFPEHVRCSRHSTPHNTILTLGRLKIPNLYVDPPLGGRSIPSYFVLCQNLQFEPNRLIDAADWNTESCIYLQINKDSIWFINSPSYIFYFQSVLQQASSLMSQGDDSLLSTIQVSQYQRHRENNILCHPKLIADLLYFILSCANDTVNSKESPIKCKCNIFLTPR